MQRPQLPFINLLIGIPTRGEWKSDMGLSLMWNIVNLTQNPIIERDGKPHICRWHIMCVSSSILSTSRQRIVDVAMQNNVDNLMFLDDDMVFPETMLRDWLVEDRPVIAANCPTRSIPTYPTARNQGGLRGTPVYSDVAHSRFTKVWRVGTGLMMLSKAALAALPRPAFTITWNEELNDYNGEDWVMVEHLERAGIPIVLDNQSSLEVQHIGSHAFTQEMVVGQRRLEAGSIITEASDPRMSTLDTMAKVDK